jgi:hypothetical protein
VFPAQEAREAVLVEDVEVAELGHVVLEQPQAVGVNCANKHGAESVKEGRPLGLGDTSGNAGFQGFCCPLRECERNNLSRLYAFFDQSRHSAGDGLRFPSAGAGDDLKMPASVVDDLLLFRG